MVTPDSPLEVTLSVEGGFAALGPQPRVYRVSDDDLAPAQAQALRDAVARAGEAPAPAGPLSGMPDVQVYRLTVADLVMVFDDVTGTPPQRELAGLVQRLASPEPGGA